MEVAVLRKRRRASADVVLVSPPYDLGTGTGIGCAIDRSPVPPLALYTLAALTREAGFSVEVIDPRASAAFLAAPGSSVSGALAVGISANTITWADAVHLARRLTSQPKRPAVILGGLHPTVLDSHALALTGADVVVRGEAEETFPELLAAVVGCHSGNPQDLSRAVAGLPGTTVRLGEEIVRGPDRPAPDAGVLSRAPVPAYELVPSGLYKMLPAETSRGCHFSCAFCSIGSKRDHRALEPAAAMSRIRAAARHLDLVSERTILFTDDCFTGSAAAPDLLRWVAREYPDVSLYLEARADDLARPELVSALRASHRVAMQVGIECGYENGLRQVGKGIGLERAGEILNDLATGGFPGSMYLSFILGFPWENAAEATATLAYAFSLAAQTGAVPQFGQWAPLPSSRLAIELGIGPELYDTPGWLHSPSILDMTYSRLSPEDVEHVRQFHALLELVYPDVARRGGGFQAASRILSSVEVGEEVC